MARPDPAVTDQHPGGAALIRSGALLVTGLALFELATAFHPGHVPEDHATVFAEYAASSHWVAVHLGQFLAALVVLAGLLALHQAVGGSGLLPVLVVAAAAATAAGIAGNMAVDGVALKQAVDAWVAAAPEDKAARFAGAETVRWLEWGANAFFQLLLGLTVGLCGVLLVRTRTAARWIGAAGVLTGACLVWAGVTVADDGFTASPAGTVASLLFLCFSLGVLGSGIRRRTASRRRSSRTPPASRPASAAR